MEDTRELNRKGWDQRARQGDKWSLPVDAAAIWRARAGDWSVVLTPTRPVPRNWLGDIAGKDVLGLASGGGQQCPIFAAAGARVTSFDASAEQLARDRLVATRESLEIVTVEGFMEDLSVLPNAAFDLVFHPVSNCYSPVILPVWREVARVLRPGGTLLAGFVNPVAYVFDPAAQERGANVARYGLPYSDLDLPPDQLAALVERDHTVEYSHTLTEQIGGQLDAGLLLTALYEDTDADPPRPVAGLFPPYIATRAVKPG